MPAPSPFAVLENTFGLLAAEPFALTLDGRQLGCGLPCRQVSVVELPCLLTRPSACGELHDRVIEVVLGRMRQQRATWVVVLGGLVLPGLRCRAGQLGVASDQRRALEVEAQLLWEFAAALRRGPCAVHRLARDLLQLAQASSTHNCHAGTGCRCWRAGPG